MSNINWRRSQKLLIKTQKIHKQSVLIQTILTPINVFRNTPPSYSIQKLIIKLPSTFYGIYEYS